MKYKILGPHKQVIKTVDKVDEVKHEDGFIYFSTGKAAQHGQLRSTEYTPIYIIKDSCVLEIEEEESTDSD
ncbi:hypothetical protein PT279_09085 [Bifidobacterium sp. ESL0784]|uniref:hypothetical protein n=1 Tax=Bifidobacterium sp. ESL0784 TaxID=2983231 RepID=UPI0023F816D7|nr:hypothetical protein [Bifidobacterium sp. ESL0784]MDF7641736.1 hypothetical protein [Bifidobacterium sp. ESL0784]